MSTPADLIDEWLTSMAPLVPGAFVLGTLGVVALALRWARRAARNV